MHAIPTVIPDNSTSCPKAVNLLIRAYSRKHTTHNILMAFGVLLFGGVGLEVPHADGDDGGGGGVSAWLQVMFS